MLRPLWQRKIIETGASTPTAAPSATPCPTSQTGSSAASRSPQSVRTRPKRKLVYLYRPEEPTLEQHARELLRYLQLDDVVSCRGCNVLARDLKRMYPAVCRSLGWKPRAWNGVAVELRKLTGRRKNYAWVEGRRLRVYRIPKRTVTALKHHG